nr:hypothetical protein [uncultured Pseudomonas sp.]
MSDKSREEFEAFACMRTGGTAEEIAAERREDSYRDEDLATGWFVWQASRDSMAVPHFCGYKFEGCQYYDAGSVDEALEDLGLKVKP